MKNLLHPEPYEEILGRIENLTPDSQAHWGKMNVGQMLTHCQGPIKVPLSKKPLKKPPFMFRILFLFFKKQLYNDKPWQKGLPTAREFRITDERDFQQEKGKLLQLIHEFHSKGEKADWPRHPAGVEFSSEQWGKMQYKHLDHHLRQFGV